VCITERRNDTLDGSLGCSGLPPVRSRDANALPGSRFRPPVTPNVANRAVARWARPDRGEGFQLRFAACQSMITRRRDVRSAKTMAVPETERIVLAGAAGRYDDTPDDGGDGRHDRAVSSRRRSSVACGRPTVCTSVRVRAVVDAHAIELCGSTSRGCSQSRGEG
jgi:hypothetical protein